MLMLVRVLSASMTGFCSFYAFSVLPLPQNIRIIVSDPDTHHHALYSGVKRTRWRASVGAILIGFIGVLIVLQPTSSSINAGHVACLGVVVAAAVNSDHAESRPARKNIRHADLSVGWQFPDHGVDPSLCLCADAAEPSGGCHADILAGISGRCLHHHCVEKGECRVVAPMQYSQIIWAGVFGTAFFDHQLTWGFVGGAALIVMSGLYIVRREWTRADLLQPVLYDGTFRPDSGYGHSFYCRKCFDENSDVKAAILPACAFGLLTDANINEI